jgi:hypothetical protein
MTEDDLQAIEARADAATSQPWEACKLSEGLGYVYSSGLGDVVAGSSSAAFLLDDAEFIAAARRDVPALVAEVRRLREALVDAWDAGFHSSGEGWNGEYPFNHPGRPTAEELKRLQTSRDEALALFMTMT